MGREELGKKKGKKLMAEKDDEREDGKNVECMTRESRG